MAPDWFGRRAGGLSTGYARRSALIDAAWGAAVTVALSVLPCSSIAGGAVAANRAAGGYLRGFGVGALAGVLAGIPLLVLFVPALFVAGWLGFGFAPGAPGYDLFLAVVFALYVLYTVGLSALGGLLGTWAHRHTAWDLDPARWL